MPCPFSPDVGSFAAGKRGSLGTVPDLGRPALNESMIFVELRRPWAPGLSAVAAQRHLPIASSNGSRWMRCLLSEPGAAAQQPGHSVHWPSAVSGYLHFPGIRLCTPISSLPLLLRQPGHFLHHQSHPPFLKVCEDALRCSPAAQARHLPSSSSPAT